MKKLILIPIILLLCYSCSEKKSDNNFTAIIDGFSSDSISIKGGNLSKPLYRSDNNKFSTTIGSSAVNYYTLVIDSVEIPLYIEDGTSLKLHTSTHNLLNNLKFEGANSKINNYLIEKELALLELFKDEKAIYSLDQVKFKTKINNTIADFASKLDLLKDEFPNFVSAEKQYLEYDKHLFLLNFRYYHVQYTKDESFKLADGFMPQDYKNIVYNDSLAYNNSKSYNALALNNGMWKTLVKIGQDYNNLKPENLQEALDEIKFSALKNDVINRFSSSTLTPENPKMKEIYEIYVSESTNDEIDKKLKIKYEAIKYLIKGSPSPVFENFENYKGGTTSLVDLKGKYVLIDIWATWCAPCLVEMPALKKLEEEYANKNIAFVSISVDTPKNHGKWKEMVKNKKLGGVQLISPNVYDNSFMKNYSVTAIPRFILLDPEGKIVSANAPKPSDKSLKTLLNKLNI